MGNNLFGIPLRQICQRSIIGAITSQVRIAFRFGRIAAWQVMLGARAGLQSALAAESTFVSTARLCFPPSEL